LTAPATEDNGVLLQGQTNAHGYFQATNTSGAFLLETP
jgi:hypothetical protein